MRCFVRVFLAIGLVLILATGCWNPFSSDGNGNGNGNGGYDRLTRNNLMEFFANAYEEEDIDQYEECLHDKFLFKFTKEAAESAGLPPDQPWWGKTADVAATRNMFDAPNVGNIVMNLASQIDWYVCVDVREHETPPDTITGWCARYDPTIDVTIDEGQDSERTLIVRDSWLNVIVTPDPKSTIGEWVVVKIEELEKSPG
jgi:hypothetical protein